jgi:hypothetical protein
MDVVVWVRVDNNLEQRVFPPEYTLGDIIPHNLYISSLEHELLHSTTPLKYVTTSEKTPLTLSRSTYFNPITFSYP